MVDDPASIPESCAFLRLLAVILSGPDPIVIPVDVVATDEAAEVRVRLPGGGELRHRIDPETWALGVLGGLIAGDEQAAD